MTYLMNIVNTRNVAATSTRLPKVVCCSRGCVISKKQSTAFFSTSSRQLTTPDNVDVAIVGGGPVGLAFASALASATKSSERPLKISLLDAGDLDKVRHWSPGPPPSFSNRVVSVTRDNVCNLQDINAWRYIESGRTQSVEDMQVWDGISNAQISFNSRDIEQDIYNNDQEPWMAKMVEILNIQRGLLKYLDDSKSSDIIDKTKVVSIERDSPDKGSWPIVNLDNGRMIRSRLLVGADGFNSPVKSFANIQSKGWDYDAQAVVATLDVEPRPFYSTAYQRFLPTGPIAFLPLSENSASLVWSTKPNIAKALKSLSGQELAAMINAAFYLPVSSLDYLYSILLKKQEDTNKEIDLIQEISWRTQVCAQGSAHELLSPDQLPPIVTQAQPKTIAGFPLRMRHADSYLGEPLNGGVPSRTALIGDAAHITHPLAGQGLNTGLGDAFILADSIKKSHELGLDIGLLTSLVDYPRQRYFNNHVMLSVIDKLHKLNSVSSEPVVGLRSAGLEILNELPFLKSMIMGFAGSSTNNRLLDNNNSSPKFLFNSMATISNASLTLASAGKSLSKLVRNRLV